MTTASTLVPPPAARRADCRTAEPAHRDDDLSDWTNRARCRDEDPETFFPLGEGETAYGQIDHAKSICALCAVRTQCLHLALSSDSQHGVWGGLSAKERRFLRRPLE